MNHLSCRQIVSYDCPGILTAHGPEPHLKCTVCNRTFSVRVKNKYPMIVGKILDVVGGSYGKTIEELQEPRRSRSFADPRQICVWLLRRYTTWSYKDIGELFGRDHSTMIHSELVVHKRSLIDREFKDLLHAFEAQIGLRVAG